MSSDSTVLGVVVLTRHGDRQGFYQSPTTYTASSTKITALGNQQEYQLGQLLRNIYLDSSSDSFISGLNTSIVDLDQLSIRADAGGEGGVIVNSAASLLQGLFPANSNYTTTLANGTTIEGPLDGYQYISIESVEPNNDVSLEGWTSCGNFDEHTATFYNSSVFSVKAEESAEFLDDLSPYMDGRPVVLTNMWNVYDYMNVENIHDASFADNIPDTFMQQARALANWHQYRVFTDTALDGIGNIAGRTVLPSIFSAFDSITNGDVKFALLGISYKPFISLFNMTRAVEMNPSLEGIVNYASALALEIRQPSSGGEPVIRFNFKNGTNDDIFTAYHILGEDGDVALSTFVNYLAPAAINTTSEWCTVCSNTEDRGCGALALAASEASAAADLHQRISPVSAGLLGAGVTLFVALAMFAVLVFLGVLTVGKGRLRYSKKQNTGIRLESEKCNL